MSAKNASELGIKYTYQSPLTHNQVATGAVHRMLKATDFLTLVVMKTIQCFNCGIAISRKQGNETSEHIPMQGLFEGFGDEYKKNRITVPCCYECNNERSRTLDEEFRNLIAVASDHPNLTGKATRAMFQYKGELHRFRLDQYGRLGIHFNTQPVIDYQKKIFKGLFYHRYRYPLPDHYTLVVQLDREGDESYKPFADYLLRNFNYKHSGHPDIFKYIIQPFRGGLNNPSKSDLSPNVGDKYYLALMIFNKSFASLAYAGRIN